MERENLLFSSDEARCSDEEATPSLADLQQHKTSKFQKKCGGRNVVFRRILPWVLHLALLSTSLGLLIKTLLIQRSLPAICVEDRLQWTITMDSVPDTHHFERLVGNFNRSSSPYKGPPSPAVDAAWAELTDYGAISISEETFGKLNASKNAVRVPAEYGGGRLAFVEAIHQLHCLESLWRHTYPAYYKEAARKIEINDQEWHDHMDHCVDMLRQKLMCDADVHLVTYNWLKGHDAPHPNFNTARQCRSFEAVKQYVMDNALDGSNLPKMYFEKPKDGSVMEYEEPPYDPLADGWPSSHH
ncbi:uncharacterized protein EAF02_007218 [Botrytis sinoallii]|uniref:uncharacterized protein n=1 Tax=Botrytis sinoallii TaxID=1463999 RepID=UPI0018FF4219|nr:uncharacterized protein EAF02_007218 [Botrytis sinoallii]KAF7880372.1 hypothetical protein EAF02_007218 [Botrytis sinoallii]